MLACSGPVECQSPDEVKKIKKNSKKKVISFPGRRLYSLQTAHLYT